MLKYVTNLTIKVTNLSIVKKFVLSFLIVFYVFFVLVATPVAAQSAPSAPDGVGPWYGQSYPQWATKVFSEENPTEIFGERYTYAQVTWILHSLTAVILGPDITNCVIGVNSADLGTIIKCATGLLPNSSSGASNMSGGTITGLAYLTGSFVGFRPASGIGYIQEKARALHIISSVNAQQTGVGFSTLSPVQTLWSAVRNISYALMVVVVIVMAFMIMFRTKISPQTVITVQSALPKIVIAIILITFSYAIAGFLVDLMYVVVGAFAAMINISGTTGSGAISSSSPADLFVQLTSVNGLVSISIGIAIFALILAVGGVYLGAAVIPTTLVLPILGTGATLGGSIVLIIFAIFLLFILFRLFILMVRTAAETVLLIVIGPILILTETLGGGGFGGWIRRVLGNLAVYPTVAIMIFLAHYFFWGWFLGGLISGFGGEFGSCGTVSALNTYCIRQVGYGSINLPGMPIATTVLGFFISFIILFLIPNTAHVIEALINKKPVDVRGAIKQGYGPADTAATAGLAWYFGKTEAADKDNDGTGRNPIAQAIRAITGRKI